MTSPRVDPITGQPFNLLAYVPVVLIFISGAGAWASIQSDNVALEARMSALEVRQAEGVARGVGREERIRVLETAVAAMQSDVRNMAAGIGRIEANLGTAP